MALHLHRIAKAALVSSSMGQIEHVPAKITAMSECNSSEVRHRKFFSLLWSLVEKSILLVEKNIVWHGLQRQFSYGLADTLDRKFIVWQDKHIYCFLLKLVVL